MFTVTMSRTKEASLSANLYIDRTVVINLYDDILNQLQNGVLNETLPKLPKLHKMTYLKYLR